MNTRKNTNPKELSHVHYSISPFECSKLSECVFQSVRNTEDTFPSFLEMMRRKKTRYIQLSRPFYQSWNCFLKLCSVSAFPKYRCFCLSSYLEYAACDKLWSWA